MKRTLKTRLMTILSLLGLIIMLPVISCNDEATVMHGEKQKKEMVFYDTLELGLNEYLYHSTYQLRLDYDSLVQECRCPENVICIWAGFAAAQMHLTIGDNAPVSFVLGTKFGNQVGINQDTIFDGFEFKLINCLPYPNTNHRPDPSEYKVLITVTPTIQR